MSMIRTFLKITALVLTSASAFFFVRGNISLSPENIARLSELRAGGYNESLVKNLSSQNADTTIGFCLLIASLFCQFVDSLWPKRGKDYSIDNVGIILSIVFSTIVFLVLYYYVADSISYNNFKKAMHILNTN
jgi:hypothetical protein